MAIDSFSGENFFLSNFFPIEIEYDGRKWKTSEHAYQAMKVTNFAEQEAIRAVEKPGKAARLGKLLLLRQDWEQVKFRIMKEVLISKFSIPEMKEKLLATGDEELIEGNNWGDQIWGVCDGKGENWLGKLLMEVRDEMRKGNG